MEERGINREHGGGQERPPLIPGLTDPQGLTALVLERTLEIERTIRRRRMIMLAVGLVAVFTAAVVLLVSGLSEQAERRAANLRIGMYGLSEGGRFVQAPIVMWRETVRQDLRVARDLAREEGVRPILSPRLIDFLDANGAEPPMELEPFE
jgi:hypothetical protein